MQHSIPSGQRTLPPRFFEALEQEILLSQDMIAILDEEQKALVAMDMEALLRLSSKKENRLSRIQGLDTLLVGMAGEFSAELPGNTVRLGALIPLLSREEGERVDQYRSRLTTLRTEILNRTQANRSFAADVKTYLDDAISLITSGIADRPLYGLSGRGRKPSLSQPSLISREV